MLKVGILSSTNGTDLPALFSSKIKDVEFACFITNKEACGALNKAKKFNIDSYVINTKENTREEFEQKVIQILRKKGVELILLVGFMRILSPLFIKTFPNAILNVHPSLLPAFARSKDKDIHNAVLKKGCKISGATIHFVDEGLDSGPILMQECVKIIPNETADGLKEKIQKLEQNMLIKSVELFRDKRITIKDNIATTI